MQKPARMFISPYEKTGGIVWFPRMLRKIRLRLKGALPADYQAYMGLGFDRRCVRFLGVDYELLARRVAEGGTDEEILAWCLAQSGCPPTAFQVLVWNEYMIKRGWRDTDAEPGELQAYKERYGLGLRADILTYFDFYEVDEGRKP